MKCVLDRATGVSKGRDEGMWARLEVESLERRQDSRET